MKAAPDFAALGDALGLFGTVAKQASTIPERLS